MARVWLLPSSSENRRLQDQSWAMKNNTTLTAATNNKTNIRMTTISNSNIFLLWYLSLQYVHIVILDESRLLSFQCFCSTFQLPKQQHKLWLFTSNTVFYLFPEQELISLVTIYCSITCTIWCLFNVAFWLKLFPQSWQLYGFSPVCILICLVSGALEGNIFPHSGQLWYFPVRLVSSSLAETEVEKVWL